MRTERDPMGMGGRAYYLDAPAELASLPSEAARLVPERLAELFQAGPGALPALVERAPLEGLRRWLTSLAGARWVLEVYLTRHARREARLRFYGAEPWSPSISGVAREPRHACPALLREVHELVGDVDDQLGCSGRLVPLDELATLDELVRDQRVLGFDELAADLRASPERASALGIFDADGDWLCVTERGHTFWAGAEWVSEPIAPLGRGAGDGALAAALDAYFTALAEGRYFRAS
jgi:hypothetical protein